MGKLYLLTASGFASFEMAFWEMHLKKIVLLSQIITV